MNSLKLPPEQPPTLTLPHYHELCCTSCCLRQVAALQASSAEAEQAAVAAAAAHAHALAALRSDKAALQAAVRCSTLEA